MGSFHHDSNRLLLIAGPCALESEAVVMATAEAIAQLAQTHAEHLQVVFKGSFDKANRSSLKSPRGPGLSGGLKLLGAVQERFGLLTTTDIHQVAQVETVAEVCALLQVPAFLCRQTDLLCAVAQSGAAVSVKKGQFLSPQEMRYVTQKLAQAGATEVLQIERGTTFGYQNLVVDMRGIAQMQAHGYPVVFDATHSVQLPGAGDGITVGQRSMIPLLSRAALAAGANGLFVETHPQPDQAISDAANQIPLDKLPELVDQWLQQWQLAQRLPFVAL
jgi:2-dehydro-3-deoxyphosphooctonate aldolase (KDO 8-P synthase)